MRLLRQEQTAKESTLIWKVVKGYRILIICKYICKYNFIKFNFYRWLFAWNTVPNLSNERFCP